MIPPLRVPKLCTVVSHIRLFALLAALFLNSTAAQAFQINEVLYVHSVSDDDIPNFFEVPKEVIQAAKKNGAQIVLLDIGRHFNEEEAPSKEAVIQVIQSSVRTSGTWLYINLHGFRVVDPDLPSEPFLPGYDYHLVQDPAFNHDTSFDAAKKSIHVSDLANWLENDSRIIGFTMDSCNGNSHVLEEIFSKTERDFFISGASSRAIGIDHEHAYHTFWTEWLQSGFDNLSLRQSYKRAYQTYKDSGQFPHREFPLVLARENGYEVKIDPHSEFKCKHNLISDCPRTWPLE